MQKPANIMSSIRVFERDKCCEIAVDVGGVSCVDKVTVFSKTKYIFLVLLY